MNPNTAEDLTILNPDKPADVLKFIIPPKPDKGDPKSEDWLRTLPEYTWFASKAKGSTSPWLDFFGISRILPECILLASRNNLGVLDWNWCDSGDFSKVNRFVAVIAPPESSSLPEAANPDKEAGDKEDG